MMSSDILIEQACGDFWELAGGTPTYPRAMRDAITLASPLELCPLEGLRVRHVLAWARRINIACRIGRQGRRLHGCLVAWRGKGVIFYDTGDADDEQRFTLAHELAHYLLDYAAPRERAVTILGSSILAVLDGERPPTVDERLHAALSSVHLGVMSHLMERPDQGLPTSAILDVEDRADRLALELLAPAQSLHELLDQPAAPRGFQTRLAFLGDLLTTSRGLPADIAAAYARFLLAQRGEPTFRDWLSGEV
ncbi:MAG: ImmA/IrrE family metallo-endopeptidase [Ktedonobacteraceae bacterium]